MKLQSNYKVATLGSSCLWTLVITVITAMPIAAQVGDVTSLPKEIPDPIANVQILETLPLGLADFDPRSLIVTDEQLATAGPSISTQVLLNDPFLLVVDDDLTQCPNAQFTSIQAAVFAAPPGGKIQVCPGTYNESVIVDKTLTLQAPRQQGLATQCMQQFPPDPTKEAVVNYPSAGTGIGFNLQANSIVLDGFTVQASGPPSPITQPNIGIFTSAAFSGYDIQHNVVQQNSFGVYLNSSGANRTLLRQNCIRNNTVGQVNVTPALGNGVYSDQGLRNADIRDNYFTGHDNAAVILTGAFFAVSDVLITHNESVDDSSIALFVTSNVAANYNKVTRSNGTAIFLGGGVSNSDVSFNILQDGTGNGISLTDIGVTAAPNINIRIKSNKIIGFLGHGLRLNDNAQANTAETNRIEGNGRDGIRAETGSGAGGLTPNIIQNNHMRSNIEHDCHDNSTGPNNAPALVANKWINDLGGTENKPGLCKNATP